ncbi:MAG: DUF2817 domain-containing protein, partial [Ilumatobacteraceae bacterium]
MARRTRLAILPAIALVLVAAGCTERTESAADPAGSVVGSSSGTAPLGSTAADTTTDAPITDAPTSTTTLPADTTSVPTTVTPTSTPPVTPPVTTVPAGPPVGQFSCAASGVEPSSADVRPPSAIPAPELPAGWRTAVVGRSVQGRGIDALVRTVDAPRRRVLVIGGIHGNEPVTPPAVRAMVGATIAPDVEVWLVPESNPDGSAAGLRCNANGVDLNRNFPFEWDPADGGPAASSEPETRTMALLVERLQPDVVVWVHQPLGYVSAVGETDPALEQAWAAAAGIPVREDVTQHGGGESWSALVAGVPSVLIEVQGWEATPDL